MLLNTFIFTDSFSESESEQKVTIAHSYLVNINADPAMNEMLVYYLKDTVTRIGTKDAEKQVSHSVTLHRFESGLESLFTW